MENLHKKVIRILRQHLGEVTDGLELIRSTGRVTGVIVSPRFNGLSDNARQRLMARALKADLTKQEREYVGPIAALSSQEAESPATRRTGRSNGTAAHLHKKVIGVLRKSFGRVTDLLEDVDKYRRVTGVIVSSAFNGLDFDERQERLSAALKAGLTPEEEENVGPIAVLTPAEAEAKTA